VLCSAPSIALGLVGTNLYRGSFHVNELAFAVGAVTISIAMTLWGWDHSCSSTRSRLSPHLRPREERADGLVILPCPIVG
jgi:hypothetical protein